MHRVAEFFKNINGILHDVSSSGIEEKKQKGWRDNVVATLMLVGIFSLSPSIAFAYGESDNSIPVPKQHSVQDYLKEGNSLIRDMYIQGMLSQKYKVNVINPNQQESEAITIPGLPCQVNWGINNKGLAQSLISGVDLKQTELYRDMTLLHETSHCELLKIKSPFQNSGLKADSEKFFNEWLVGGMIPQNPINNFFAENFADSYGMLMLLSKNNFSDESVNELKRWYEIRKIKREMDERQGNAITFDAHYTDFSLKKIIDSLDKIKMQSPTEYKSVALNIASQSVVEWLNKNREMQPLNKDVSVPNNEGKTRIVGNEGYNVIMSGIENNDWFYTAILGQVQLLSAENQKIVKTPYVFQNYGANDSRTIATSILSGMKDSAFTKAKVKLINKKELKWNFDSEERGRIYVSYILNTIDSGKYIEDWKEKNHWTTIQKDIDNNLSKKYKNDFINIEIPSLSSLSERLKGKPFAASSEDIQDKPKENATLWR